MSRVRRRGQHIARRRAEAQSRRVDTTAYDALLYRLNHDLRAPARSIVALSEWIAEDGASSGEHLALLRNRALRIDKMLRGLAALEAAGRKGRTSSGCVRETACEALESCTWNGDTRLGGPLSLRTDHTALRTALVALLDNVARHAEAQKVTLSWQRYGAGIRLSVRDDGIGIEARHATSVWDPFVTVRSRDEVESAGLGLAVVRRLCGVRQGRAWFEASEQKGLGVVLHWV